MSNKTTFKRIALAVVAALGLGLLSMTPSQASISNLSVTAVNGKASTTGSDSSTAAVVTVSGFVTSASDSLLVTILTDGARPTVGGTYAAPTPRVYLLDSTTTASRVYSNVTSLAAPTTDAVRALVGLSDSKSVDASAFLINSSTIPQSIGAKFLVQFDSISNIQFGTYNYEAVVQGFSHLGAVKTELLERVKFSIVVEKPAAVIAQEDEVVDPTQTVAVLAATSGGSWTTTTVDSVLSVSAVAAAAPKAYVRVLTKNKGGFAADESVTVTITGAGVLALGAIAGSELKLTGAGGISEVEVRSDGRAGVGSIVVATTTKTFAAKTITFYAATPSTVEPTVRKPVVNLSLTTDVIRVTAKDANGNIWGGSAWLHSTDTSIATAPATACTFTASTGIHTCSVTGVKAGQSKFKVANNAVLASATVATAEFDGPRITSSTAASVKIEFDKAAYAPGEKALIYVTPLDAAGLTLQGDTFTALLSATGITSNTAFSAGGDSADIGASQILTSAFSSAATGAKAGSKMYTVYMPFGKGTVTISATGGALLPTAGQVAVTASASVVDDSVDAAVDAAQEATDAAIAATDAAILAQEAADEAASAAIAAQETAQAAVDAVTALSAEVTKLIAQLATLQKLLNRVAKRVGVKR